MTDKELLERYQDLKKNILTLILDENYTLHGVADELGIPEDIVEQIFKEDVELRLVTCPECNHSFDVPNLP